MPHQSCQSQKDRCPKLVQDKISIRIVGKLIEIIFKPEIPQGANRYYVKNCVRVTILVIRNKEEKNSYEDIKGLRCCG